MFVSDHPNAFFLQLLYDKADDGARELLEASLDDSFVCHGVGETSAGGTFVGPEAFLGHLSDLARGTQDHHPLAFYADDTWGIVPQVMTGSRNGHTLNLSVAGFWRFSAQELLAEHWECVSDVAEWDAFWSN